MQANLQIGQFNSDNGYSVAGGSISLQSLLENIYRGFKTFLPHCLIISRQKQKDHRIRNLVAIKKPGYVSNFTTRSVIPKNSKPTFLIKAVSDLSASFKKPNYQYLLIQR